jgi:lysophospholipase L1-like esterase
VVTGVRMGRSMVLLACLAVGLVPTGCGAEDSETAPSTTSPPSTNGFDMGAIESGYSGSGPTLVVLGDSITDQSRDELHQVLDPHYRTKIAAVTGEGFANGPLSASLGKGRAVMLETATDYARGKPTKVVIALGTNDAWNPRLSLDATHDAMAKMVAMFIESCVVGVEVSEWSEAESYDPNKARALNAQLRALADVIVPPLPPSEVGSDMIHPRTAGRKAFADAVASGVRQCPST